MKAKLAIAFSVGFIVGAIPAARTLAYSKLGHQNAMHYLLDINKKLMPYAPSEVLEEINVDAQFQQIVSTFKMEK